MIVSAPGVKSIKNPGRSKPTPAAVGSAGSRGAAPGVNVVLTTYFLPSLASITSPTCNSVDVV